MTKVAVDVRNSADSVNAEGRLNGRYICNSANWLQGMKTEAKFNNTPVRIM